MIDWIIIGIVTYIAIGILVTVTHTEFIYPEIENNVRDSILAGVIWPILFGIWILRKGPGKAFRAAQKSIPTYLGPTREIIKEAWNKK